MRPERYFARVRRAGFMIEQLFVTVIPPVSLTRVGLSRVAVGRLQRSQIVSGSA